MPSTLIPSVLAGKRIVVTQAVHQAGELCDLLAVRAAVALPYPCIAIEPPDDADELDDALRRAAVGEFDWLVVTSANTVMMLAARLATLGLASDMLAPLSIAAVGAATAAALRACLGLTAALTPAEQQATGLATALAAQWQTQASQPRVLLPQANLASPALAQQLTAAGARVVSVTAYRTTLGNGGVDLPAHLAAGQVDAITFTSSSTVHNLWERLRKEGGDPAQLAPVCAVCIGPVTAQTARDYGFTQPLVAPAPNMEGLVHALETHWSQKP